MTECYIVTNYKDIPLFVVNKFEDVVENIKTHYTKFLGNNGKVEDIILNKKHKGEFAVCCTYKDKDNNIQFVSRNYKVITRNIF